MGSIEESSAMLFPSTPNADNQMSFSGGGVPVVQWIPTVMQPIQSQQELPQGSTPPQGTTAGHAISEPVTVLQPVFWAPGCKMSPPAIPPPQTSPQGPLPQMLLQAPPPSATALQESISVLPPAFWASGAPRLE